VQALPVSAAQTRLRERLSRRGRIVQIVQIAQAELLAPARAPQAQRRVLQAWAEPPVQAHPLSLQVRVARLLAPPWRLQGD